LISILSVNIPPDAGKVCRGQITINKNMVSMLDTFGHYWRRAMAGINSIFGRDQGLRSQLAQLEQQFLTLASATQTLDGKQEHIRAEAARHRSELQRRIDGLDQICKENNNYQAKVGPRLSECEHKLARLETECSQDRETIAALETSVTETTHRLETRNQQIKFLQDSAREQLQAFKTELAEASSRLETRDNETNHRLEEENQLLVSLEGSQTEILERIDAADREITTLHKDVAEQRLQTENFLDSATIQLEVTNNLVTLLERRVQTDIELQEKQFQQLKLQLQLQETRLVRTIFAVAGVLLLLLVTMAVLR
jgi:chromosome segregation ATPase